MSVKLTVSALAMTCLAATTATARDQVQVAGSSTVLPYASIVAEAFGAVAVVLNFIGYRQNNVDRYLLISAFALASLSVIGCPAWIAFTLLGH